MNNLFLIVMLLTGCFLVSCNEDINEIIVSQNESKMTVRAIIGEQTDSRVALTQQDNGNIKTTWKDGDAFLGVINGTMVEFTGGESEGTVADFTPNVTVVDGAVVNALYPLSDSYKDKASSTEGFEVSLAGQDGTLDKLANYTYMTAQATAADNTLNFKFKHEIVILRLTGMTFPDEVSNVFEIVVSGTGISDVAVANLSGSTPVVNVSATDCSVNVKGNFTVSDKVMQDVYVAFFPTDEISNLTISAITSDSKPYHFSYNGNVNFEAGKVYTLSDKELSGIIRVSQYATYPDEEVYYAIDYTDIQAIDEYDYNSGYFANRTIIMLNDIDMSQATSASNLEKSYVGTSQFQGTFDGMGHVIKGMKYQLFYQVKNAIVMNLALEGNIESTSNVELLGIGLGETKVINVHNKCTVNADVLVAGLTKGTDIFVFACSNQADLSSSENQVSAIATSANSIVGCFNAGTLSGTKVDGISTISNVYGCYNIGAMNATSGKHGIGSSSNVYNSIWLTTEAEECNYSIKTSTNNVGCTSIDEVNNNVSVLNAGIQKWNTENPTNLCEYHFVKGTNGKGPQLVYGVPQ